MGKNTLHLAYGICTLAAEAEKKFLLMVSERGSMAGGS